MDIDVSHLEHAIAEEYIKLYGEEMKKGDFMFTNTVMNIAASAAAIAIKQYDEMRKQS